MAITTQTKTQLIEGQAAAIQSSAAGLTDFSVGSILRALIESIADVVLWLQAIILYLLLQTRAATATGTDLDTWMADYGIVRLAAQPAAGVATFARFTASGQGLVPVGTIIETADLSQSFVVIADTTNSAYSAILGGYVLANLISSVSVPVQAQTAGAAGNVAAGTVTVIAQGVPGIDTVTNAAPFAAGSDAETDAELRVRFIAYIQSLSKATLAAVGFAITSVQQGVFYSITENFTYAGVAFPGHFSVVVDDGSGSPSSTFLTSVYNAIDPIRPVGSTFEVHGPIVLNAAVQMTISVAAGYTKATVAATVQAALLAYIDSLAIGQTLAYTRLAQIAYDASPGVTNVSAVTLNSATADLTPTSLQVIKASPSPVVNAP